MNQDRESIILTPSVMRFEKALRLQMQMPTATIFAVTGIAGIGKSMAVNHYVAGQQLQAHTGLPSCIKIIVPPKPTPRSLTTAILAMLAEQLRGRNAKELADHVMGSLERYDIRLLIFDEGDRLNDASFDMLRDIYDQTHRPMVLVGLPRLMGVIERYEQFNSRVAMEIEFKSLSLDELRTTFLPHIQFSKWHFDPNLDEDAALAEYVWKQVNPSLRRLVNWIQIANAIAEADNMERVTLETMKEATEFFRLNSGNNQDDSAYEASDTGWQEMLSETRKRAKR